MNLREQLERIIEVEDNLQPFPQNTQVGANADTDSR